MITTDFKNALEEKLNGTIAAEEMEAVLKALDGLEGDYDVRPAEVVDEIRCRNGDVLTEYLETKTIEGCAAGTVNNYRYLLRQMMDYLAKDLDEIETADIRRFLRMYKETRQVSDASLDKYREAICWFFKWCHMEGRIRVCPTRNLKPIRHEEKERKAMSRLELELLRNACIDQRERAIVEFLYSTAFRVSELCKVKKSDVNFRERTVRIVGKGKKERTSWINDRCLLELTKYLESRDDENEYLFVNKNRPHGKMGRTSVERMIRKIQGRTGDQISFRVTPHCVRHTAATNALAGGMKIEQIQTYLGHAKLETTMRYAHVSTEDVKDSHKRFVV